MLHDPTFYVAISFVIFLILIGRPVLKIILKMLDERGLNIKNMIDKATKTREEAEKVLNATKTQEGETLEQITAIKTHASFEAERIKSEARKKLEETIEREEGLTSEQISRAENQAIEDIKHEAVRMAVLSTQKILEDNVDKKVNDKLVDQALDEIEELDLKVA